jgi:hypothetical protein
MGDVLFDYDTLMDQCVRREPIEILGVPWIIEAVERMVHPIQGPMVRIRLTVQAKPNHILTGGMMRLVYRESEGTRVASRDHAQKCRDWAQEAESNNTPLGVVFSNWVNAMLGSPETCEHEAIARGRHLLNSGLLETGQQMRDFLESVE